MAKQTRPTINHTKEDLERFDTLGIQQRMEIFHNLGREKFVLMYGAERIPQSNEYGSMEDFTDPTGRIWRSKKYYDDYVRLQENYMIHEEPSKDQLKYPDGNPKTKFGITKPRDTYTPPIPYLEYSLAHLQGALKYGPFNWRDDPVTMSTYLDAAISHIKKFREGQDRARDTDIHELGHAMTCLSIVIDGQAYGVITDDRWKPRDQEKHPDYTRKLDDWIESNQGRVKAIREKWTDFAERFKAGEIDKNGDPIKKTGDE